MISFAAPMPLGMTSEGEYFDVETDDFIVLILEAHRREIVIEADDDLVACARTATRARGRCRLLLAAAARESRHGENEGRAKREEFLHVHVWFLLFC